MNAEHAARRAAAARTDARLAELAQLTPAERRTRWLALRAESAALRGTVRETCVRRAQIRGELTLLESLR